MPPALIPIAGAVAGAAANKLFGGGQQQTQEIDPQTAQFIELQRQYGTAAAQQITGFDPATGAFGAPGGQFAGPLAEGFDMESVNRFLNPFVEGQQENLVDVFGRMRARAGRGAAQDATLQAGAGRDIGARGALLQGLREGDVDQNFLRAINNLNFGAFGQASQLALGAQPFRNQALGANQAVQRLQLGQGLLAGAPNQQLGQVQTGPSGGVLPGAAAGAQIAAGLIGPNIPIPSAPGTIPVPAPPPAPSFPATSLAPTGLVQRPRFGG